MPKMSAQLRPSLMAVTAIPIHIGAFMLLLARSALSHTSVAPSRTDEPSTQ